jgi:hypothetical protein
LLRRSDPQRTPMNAIGRSDVLSWLGAGKKGASHLRERASAGRTSESIGDEWIAGVAPGPIGRRKVRASRTGGRCPTSQERGELRSRNRETCGWRGVPAARYSLYFSPSPPEAPVHPEGRGHRPVRHRRSGLRGRRRPHGARHGRRIPCRRGVRAAAASRLDVSRIDRRYRPLGAGGCGHPARRLDPRGRRGARQPRDELIDVGAVRDVDQRARRWPRSRLEPCRRTRPATDPSEAG